MLAGYDNESFFQSVAGIMSRHKKGITVLANPAFNLLWNTDPVSHRYISYELHVMPAALRVFWELSFRKLKKPPHTLNGYILNKVFLLFPGCFGHW